MMAWAKDLEGMLDLDEARGIAIGRFLLSAPTRGLYLRNRRLAIVHHIKAADFYRANTCFDEATDRCLLKASELLYNVDWLHLIRIAWSVFRLSVTRFGLRLGSCLRRRKRKLPVAIFGDRILVLRKRANTVEENNRLPHGTLRVEVELQYSTSLTVLYSISFSSSGGYISL